MKILFISHDASRTGAPILLLRLIEQVKRNSSLEILILFKNGGELQADFGKLGECFFWNVEIKNDRFIEILKQRLARRLGIKRMKPLEKYRKTIVEQIDEAEIVFNNTITNSVLLKELTLKGKKVFSYFHELSIVTHFNCSWDDVEFLKQVSVKIFVPSTAVKSFLIKEFAIAAHKIALLKYIIPQSSTSSRDRQFEKIPRQSPEVFLVGFCGSLNWRKGYDLLPLIAKKIITDNNISDIHFIWIGAEKSSLEYAILNSDLQKLKLNSFFTFIEPTDSASSYLSQLDVFALLSREDAFPLVVLEAANECVPCIYFKESGGIGEFLGIDAGVAVDYLDIDKMADAIIKLKGDPQLRATLAATAKGKIAEYMRPKETVEKAFGAV